MDREQLFKIVDALVDKADDNESTSEILAMLVTTFARIRNKHNIPDEKLMMGLAIGLKAAPNPNAKDDVLDLVKRL